MISGKYLFIKSISNCIFCHTKITSSPKNFNIFSFISNILGADSKSFNDIQVIYATKSLSSLISFCGFKKDLNSLITFQFISISTNHI